MAVNNSLVKSQQRLGLTAYLTQDAVKDQINKVIGGKDGQRFISSIVSAVTTNPALKECDNPSILNAALLGESLKLSPSPQLGQFYFVPYGKKTKVINQETGREEWIETKQAQFQIGYKGYLQLAIRSGQYKKINVLAIKEGELIRFDPLNEEIEVKLIEDEEEREGTKTVGYFAMFEYLNGFRKAIYWSRDKMLRHADKYSPAFSKDGCTKKVKGKDVKVVSFADYEAGKYNEKDEWLYSSFWYKDFDEMAKKTMLRQLISKWGIMSIELQNAIESDMAVINEDGTKNYVDTEPDVIDMPADEVSNQSQEEPKAEAPQEQASEPADVQAALFG